MTSKSIARGIVVVMSLLCVMASAVLAQTTLITYQGKLTETGNVANGNYEFQFKLFDAAVAGAQIGSPITTTATVTSGTFTTALDFGASAFNGPARYLEINVRLAGTANPFTLLSPRQAITSAPYGIRSLSAAISDNATQLGGVDSTRFVQHDVSGNVSITGGLTVAGPLSLNIVNAQTQYNLGGNRILSNPGTNNLFAGAGAGAGNTTGDRNSFFGSSAGQGNTTGAGNSFVGESAGLVNSDGSFNTFVGESAGRSNATGNQNAFLGNSAGRNNTIGVFNAFLGTNAGFSNTTGNSNSFVGRNAGLNNNADNNAFFGASAGQSNTTGSGNSIFGYIAGFFNTTGDFNSFFGAVAGGNNISGAENSFFGDGAGAGNATGSNNTFVGRQAGLNNTASDNSFFGHFAGQSNSTGSGNTFLGMNAGLNNATGSNNTLLGFQVNLGASNLTNAAAIGANALVSSNNSIVLGGINGVNGATGSTNVGIGTTSPASRFHVVGSSWFQGDNTPLPGTAGKGIVIGSSGDLGYISSFDYSTFTPQTLLLNNGGGKVGIGTNTPKATLDVTGGNIIVGSPGQGMILKSPNGSVCRLISISDAGAMVLTAVACP